MLVYFFQQGMFTGYDSNVRFYFGLQGHEDEVFVLEPSAIDKRILISAGHDGKIVIWDIEKGEKVKQFFNMVNCLEYKHQTHLGYCLLSQKAAI